MEMVYILEKRGDDYLIKDIVPRTQADENGLRHLTTICVLYTEDGQIICQERFSRVSAKAVAAGKNPPGVYESINFLGGHATPPDNHGHLIGTLLTEAQIYEGLRKELEEELMREAEDGEDAKKIEVWENGKNTNTFKNAAPFKVPLFKPIPIGMSEHNDPKNMEYSYIFALKISKEDLKTILIADDYQSNGKAIHVYTPRKCFTEPQLKAIIDANDPKVKIEDAITRLYAPKNKEILNKLRNVLAGGACNG